MKQMQGKIGNPAAEPAMSQGSIQGGIVQMFLACKEEVTGIKGFCCIN